ncbi:MAG TPA: ABC transporter substrate-binding protein [Steroidobacteraceae bacterium]|jgi:oligogalacturonide transport system substrate-binding protein|nr:ABC transporter substrate-binding protein [Steroidobacteraceae bacterium]
MRYLFLLCCCLATSAFAQQQDVQLRMSWWGGNDVHRAYLASIRRFEEKYPHIKVKAEYTGWVGHLERLTTQIAGGTAPDVMQVNWNWLVLFSADGRGFYDLNRVGDVLDLTQFDADARAIGTVHGHLNALPVTMTARVFYFNATTFAKAGLEVPTSWDELFAAGKIFRERLGPDYYPLALNFLDLLALCRSWVVQKTGEPLVNESARRLNADPEDTADMAALYARLVREHVIAPAPERASYGNVPEQELRPWITGKYAGLYYWTSAVGKLVETLEPGQRIVLAPYFMRPGARDAGLNYRPGMMIAMNAKTEHPREAALLIDFIFNDPYAVQTFGLLRGLPVSKSAVALLKAQGTPRTLGWEGNEQIELLPHQTGESGYFEHPRVRDAFFDILEAQGFGQIDAAESGRRMYTDINRVLERVIRKPVDNAIPAPAASLRSGGKAAGAHAVPAQAAQRGMNDG